MPSDNALKGLFTLAKDYTCQLSTTVDMEQKCQLVHAATQCLLAIIHQGNASSMDLILRARCFLIQLLLDHTQRSKERSEEALEMNESQSLDAFLLEFINQSVCLVLSIYPHLSYSILVDFVLDCLGRSSNSFIKHPTSFSRGLVASMDLL